MASYLDTQTRIASELNRSDLTGEIRLAILSAIEYYKKRRWFWNESSTTVTTTASVEYVALPTDFVDLDTMQVTIGSNLTGLKQQDISDIIAWRQTSSTGQPTDFALYQNRIELYPTPNATYTITLHYIKELTALSADADTNAWLTEGEELIRLHAKKDLYVNVIRSTAAAKDMQVMEDSILLRMESLNQRRTTTGRVRARYL